MEQNLAEQLKANIEKREAELRTQAAREQCVTLRGYEGTIGDLFQQLRSEDELWDAFSGIPFQEFIRNCSARSNVPRPPSKTSSKSSDSATRRPRMNAQTAEETILNAFGDGTEDIKTRDIMLTANLSQRQVLRAMESLKAKGLVRQNGDRRSTTWTKL